MIIQIRGTSGSGKSTIMRNVMDRMGDWQAEFTEGRKRPLYYRSCNDWPLTYVLGHYDSACGGCDTIGAAPAVFDLAINLATQGNVLCEGLLLSEDSKWTPKMIGLGFNVRCLFLTTDVERCIKQIKGRREEAGNEKPLNEKNTRNRVPVIERARLKLMEAGVECRRASPEQASDIVLRWLR